MSLELTLMFVLFFGLSAIGLPIGFAMISSGIAFLALDGRDLGLVADQIMNNLYRSFVLLAVPLFIFAADVMNNGSISDRLLKFATLLVGRIRGGLVHVDIVLSVIFSGMSGSAIADAAGPGKLMIQLMLRSGRYAPGFAGAIIAASATIGPVIPPSIPMVLYALVANTSVGYLFLGGVIPGLLMAACLMAVVAVIARRRDFPVEPPLERGQVVPVLRDSFPALLLPVILLGGIYSGAVTPTEAAAVAAAYALLLAMGFYRALSPRALLEVLIGSARSTAVVALVIAGAFLFNYIVSAERVPMLLGAWLATLDIAPLAFLLGINLLFLVLGCFVDTLLMLLVIVPILMPSVRALGIDTVHFGVVIVVNMMIGLITPPYGELLFVISGVSGIRLQAMIREIWPFLAVLIAALLLMVLFPEIVLWLPRQFGYR
jgi:tripartite ATP-independent transporter DctM subunit